MNWYYVQQGKQAGPVTDEQLDELVRSGSMAADTLVWREGMAEWAPYTQARGGAAPAPIGVAVAQPGPEAVCAECGRVFPMEETINYGNARICAACKPVFLQKLHEGAAINTGQMRYAGFWTRFVAKFVDGVVLRLVLLPVTLLITPLASKTTNPSQLLLQFGLSASVAMLVAMAYSVFMVGNYGATLGKMALKIKVVTAEGAPITYGRAFGRYFGEILSGCPTLMIGFIMAGFDDQKRALHDRICNTRVVFK